MIVFTVVVQGFPLAPPVYRSGIALDLADIRQEHTRGLGKTRPSSRRSRFASTVRKD